MLGGPERTTAAGAVLLVIVACSGGTQGPSGGSVPRSGYASGARLRARVLDAGGDAVVFEGWTDTKLGVPCAFAAGEDGVLRCLPATPASVFFLDAGCTQPVVVAASCGAPPAYVRWSASGFGGCLWEPRYDPSPQKLLAVDPPLASVPQLFAGSPTACDAASPPWPDAVAYGAHVVPPGGFVAARESKDARGTRISARTLIAEDGAKQVVGYFDESAHAPCDVIVESIGWRSDVCIPPTMAWANEWADAACTEVAAHVGKQCPKPTIAADATNDGGCWTTPTLHLYAIGAPLDAVYQTSPGGCSASRPDGTELLFATAGPIDPATLATVGVAPFGTAALRPYFRASPDGVPIVPAGLGVLPNGNGSTFRDVAQARDCVATKLADGSWRCVPAPPLTVSASTRLFADAACTQEIVDTGGAACATPPAVVIRTEASTCGDGVVDALFAPGDPIAPTALYALGAAGSCSPRGTPPSDERYYALGAPIDPSTLPSITERTE